MPQKVASTAATESICLAASNLALWAALMGAVPPYIEGREQLRIIGAVSAEVDSAACGEAAELRQVEVDQRLTVGNGNLHVWLRFNFHNGTQSFCFHSKTVGHFFIVVGGERPAVRQLYRRNECREQRVAVDNIELLGVRVS